MGRFPKGVCGSIQMRKINQVWWVLVAWVGFGFSFVQSQQPKLVLTIVVDQLRYDYLERFEPHFSKNGFRLLMDRGAFMTFGRYNYVPTVTGPGHASYLSGGGPAVHGIMGNSWFDKKTRQEVSCVSDSKVKSVGTTNSSGKASPHRFIGATMADQMRLHFGSKVISASLKDRGSILAAGKKPAGAYWYDSSTGRFVTSTYYMKELPRWVEAFNERKIPQGYVGRVWERLLPVDAYRDADKGAGEGHLDGETNTVFNHVVAVSTNGFDAFFPTPFGDEFTTEFGIAAIEGEALGHSNHPDMLCLSFSSLDGCGHKFGPYSHEIQDMMVRLDRQLERLFNHLDQKIGMKNVTIVLTSDHGVAPAPEYAQSMGLNGSREGGSFMTDLMAKLDKQYGSGKYFLSATPSYGNLFLNYHTLSDKQLAPTEVMSFIRDYALSTGLFQACYTREQLLDGRAHGWIGECVLNGFNAERSGDVVLVPKPFALPGPSKNGTTHGSPYSYDTHVPILFYGKGFKPGRFADEFYITDIAATLASALRTLEPPGSIGKPCTRILVTP